MKTATLLLLALATIPATAQVSPTTRNATNGAIIGGGVGAVIGHNAARIGAGKGAVIGAAAGLLLGVVNTRSRCEHPPVVVAGGYAVLPPAVPGVTVDAGELAREIEVARRNFSAEQAEADRLYEEYRDAQRRATESRIRLQNLQQARSSLAAAGYATR